MSGAKHQTGTAIANLRTWEPWKGQGWECRVLDKDFAGTAIAYDLVGVFGREVGGEGKKDRKYKLCQFLLLLEEFGEIMEGRVDSDRHWVFGVDCMH